MPPTLQPPFQIIAAGVCPQGLSPGARAPNVVGAVVINGGTGVWQITVTDPTALPGDCVLILSPGGGSNLAGGIAFGQSTQSVNVFSFSTYRNDTNAAVDVESQFIVVRWPAGAET